MAEALALALIGTMYAHEKQIRTDALTSEDKRAHRQTHTRPGSPAMMCSQSASTGTEPYQTHPAVIVSVLVGTHRQCLSVVPATFGCRTDLEPALSSATPP